MKEEVKVTVEKKYRVGMFIAERKVNNEGYDLVEITTVNNNKVVHLTSYSYNDHMGKLKELYDLIGEVLEDKVEVPEVKEGKEIEEEIRVW